MTAPRRQPPRVRPVFSVWAWLALSPYLLTALGGSELAADRRELGLAIATALIVHAAVLVAFGIVGMLERLTGGVPWLRWSIVVLAILGIAEGRPALLTAVQGHFGLDLVETAWPLRFLMNATILTAAVLLVHGVIETIVRARESEHRLRLVLDALESEATHIASTRLAVSAAFQRELATQVLDALGGLLTRGLPPDGLAKELRWIGRSVVQRAADQARSAQLDEALAADEDPRLPASPSPGRTVRHLGPAAAAPTWAITVTTLVLFLTPAIQTYGLLLGLLELLIAGVVSLVLAHAVQHIPLPAGRGAGITVLATLYLLVGAVYCWVLIRPLEFDVIVVYYFVYGTLGYAIVATVIAIITSGLRQLRAHERDIAAAIAESERHRFEAQRALLAEAARAGQLLDQDVQGDVLATAYRIETGTAAPDALDELVDRVEAVLRGRPTEPRDFVPHLRDGLRAILAAWGLVLELDTDVDDDALDWLARHPGSAAVAHDALTEGLTNAVRHGRGPRVTARLRRVDDTVEVIVRHEGRRSPHDGDDLGLRDLETRAAEAVLIEDGDMVELRVRLRAGSPAISQPPPWSPPQRPDKLRA